MIDAKMWASQIFPDTIYIEIIKQVAVQVTA